MESSFLFQRNGMLPKKEKRNELMPEIRSQIVLIVTAANIPTQISTCLLYISALEHGKQNVAPFYLSENPNLIIYGVN